jgi:hypothetical protein
LKEAQAAYEKSRAAVEERDYRLALNHARDARERAHQAVKDAGDEKARVRADVARMLQAAEDTLRALRDRLARAEADRATRAQRAAARKILDPLEAAVNKAREAADREDVLAARTLLAGIDSRLSAATSEIDAVLASRGPRRPARRGVR